MWSKADVVGGKSATPDKSSTARPPKKNGKIGVPDTHIQSESEGESEVAQNESEESRFSDSEDDR